MKTNKKVIEELYEELEYTQIQTNMNKLYSFLTSQDAIKLSDYHKVLLETQLNAMNIYRNCLILRISNLNQLDDVQSTDQSSTNIEQNESNSGK